ncbi:MAG TPA: hypothetical protein VLT91_01665 [Rhizomicrobium sp.]|nr:hypothetical protein [Rhizomicrobium sp.]
MKFAHGMMLIALLPGAAFAREPFMPDVIHWGATTEQMETVLAGKCKKMVTRPIDPPFLDNTRKQTQIDCEGFVFRGKPRHAEFVIGDEQLKLVWIMTGADEDAALRDAMVGEYGPPDHRNKVYDAFVAHRAAVRLDKHEVLFYAANAAGDTEPDFAPDKP